MELLKCKTCGGLLNVTEGMTYCECEYCGYNNNVADLMKKETVTKRTVIQHDSDTGSADYYLQRAYTFLEDGEYREADECCERALDIESGNVEAYLVKLMAELRVRKRSELGDCREPFDDSRNYKTVIALGGRELEAELQGYIEHIKERNENNRKEKIYSSAVEAFYAAEVKEHNEKKFEEAAQKFSEISGYKDADAYQAKCLENAAICKQMTHYSMGEYYIKEQKYGYAIDELEAIPGYKDADQLLAKARAFKGKSRALIEKGERIHKFITGLYFFDAAAVVIFWIVMLCLTGTYDPPTLLRIAMFAGSIIHSFVSGLIGLSCDDLSDKFKFLCTIAVNLFKTIAMLIFYPTGDIFGAFFVFVFCVIDFVAGVYIAIFIKIKEESYSYYDPIEKYTREHSDD